MKRRRRKTERIRSSRRRDTENSNSKSIFYKNCNLGLVKPEADRQRQNSK